MFVIRYETPLSSARDHHCIRKDVDEIMKSIDLPGARAGGRARSLHSRSLPERAVALGIISSQYRSKLAPIKRDVILDDQIAVLRRQHDDRPLRSIAQIFGSRAPHSSSVLSSLHPGSSLKSILSSVWLCQRKMTTEEMKASTEGETE